MPDDITLGPWLALKSIPAGGGGKDAIVCYNGCLKDAIRLRSCGRAIGKRNTPYPTERDVAEAKYDSWKRGSRYKSWRTQDGLGLASKSCVVVSRCASSGHKIT